MTEEGREREREVRCVAAFPFHGVETRRLGLLGRTGRSVMVVGLGGGDCQSEHLGPEVAPLRKVMSTRVFLAALMETAASVLRDEVPGVNIYGGALFPVGLVRGGGVGGHRVADLRVSS